MERPAIFTLAKVGDLQPQQTRLFEHVNTIQTTSVADANLGSKGYILHLVMYGVSLMGELNELRR